MAKRSRQYRIGVAFGLAGKARPMAQLRTAYQEAKRARRAAGLRYKKSKTAANKAAYAAAEMRWQATGQALGTQSGTHKPRHAKTHIHKGRKRGGLTKGERKHNRAMRNAKGLFTSRRKKHTQTRRRR